MSSTKREMALKLAKLSLRLFPAHYIGLSGTCSCGQRCGSPGKHPLKSGWQLSATSDAGDIAQIWSSQPDANIGIATGTPSCLLVLDFDTKGEVRADTVLKNFEGKFHRLPETLRIRTGGGGFHLYFRTPTGCVLKNTVSSLMSGLDTRSEGGYVIGPGSSHASGRIYEIDGGADVTLPHIADAPLWLIDLLRDPPSPETGHRAPSNMPPPQTAANDNDQLSQLCSEIAAAPVGQQERTLNDNSFIAGRIAADGQCAPAVAINALTAAANAMTNQKGRHPWRGAEISKKVQSAFNAGLRSKARDLTSEHAPSQASERGVLNIGSETELARLISVGLQDAYGDVKFDQGRFWVFQKTHWRELEEWELNLFIGRYDGTFINGGRRYRLNKQQYTGIRERLCDFHMDRGYFDEPTIGINCESGLITFSETGEISLLPHSADHRRRSVIECEWTPEELERKAHGFLLEKLLAGAFEADDDADEKRKLFEEILGAAGLGNAKALPQQLAFILYGPLAGNGKSQFLRVVRGLCPPYAVCSVPIDKMSDERFVCHLVGKNVNVADELSSAHGVFSDTFKSIITGEEVTGRDVYKSAVTFAPTAVHVFATNDLPSFRGGFDNGVLRRIRLLEFDRRIPTGEIIPDIGRKIVDEELQYVLTLGVRGAQRVLKFGQFTLPESSDVALRDWADNADSVRAWFEAHVNLLAGFSMPISSLYSDYKEFCETEGYQVIGGNKFASRLITISSGEISRERTATERRLRGLRLKSDLSYPPHYK